MALELSDLPPDVRKRVLEGSDERLRQTAERMERKKASRAGTGDAQPCSGSCGCGERFENYRRWETKHFGPGHSRWVIDLEPAGTAARI